MRVTGQLRQKDACSGEEMYLVTWEVANAQDPEDYGMVIVIGTEAVGLSVAQVRELQQFLAWPGVSDEV